MTHSVEEEIDMLASAGLLTERQAQAFVYRRVELVPRPEAAADMDISVSTLDDYVRDAQDKIDEAQATLDALKEIRFQHE